jgi:hypothetical protein
MCQYKYKKLWGRIAQLKLLGLRNMISESPGLIYARYVLVWPIALNFHITS